MSARFTLSTYTLSLLQPQFAAIKLFSIYQLKTFSLLHVYFRPIGRIHDQFEFEKDILYQLRFHLSLEL